MVGLSFWMNDSKVEAPIRSPAAAKTPSPSPPVKSVSSCLTTPASLAAPRHGAVGEQPAVEVVGGQDLHGDGGCMRGGGATTSVVAASERPEAGGRERECALGKWWSRVCPFVKVSDATRPREPSGAGHLNPKAPTDRAPAWPIYFDVGRDDSTAR